MDEKTEQTSAKQTPTPAKSTTEQQVSEQASNPKPTGGAVKKPSIGFIFGAINLLLILLLAGTLFYLVQGIKQQQLGYGSEISKGGARELELSKQLNAIQVQLGSTQTQMATLNKDIVDKESHFTKALADFSQLHTEKTALTKNELLATIDQIKRQLSKTRGDWLIADAEYLLNVANQRLHLVGDVNTAVLALEAADQRLRESGDAAVYAIRKQIAKEIAALGTVTSVDVVGLYSKLHVLQDNAAQLAVLLPYAGKSLTQPKPTHANDKQEVESDILARSLNLLKAYVTIKHAKQPVTQILTATEAGFIRQQLKVKLEMIKIALVQQQDDLYKRSILDAKQWLKHNFTIDAKAKNFLATLDEINAVSMRSQFPNISNSSKMLKDIVKLRLEADKAGLHPDANKANKAGLHPDANKATTGASVVPLPLL